MRMTKSVIVSVFALTTLVTAGIAPSIASADSAAVCTVAAVGTKNTAGASNSRFILNNDGTVTGTFIVTGTDCNVPVTLAVWKAPDALKGRPYSAQTLFAHTTGNFTAGTHTLTLALPDCFYQVDLVRGTSATAADGSPMYDTAVMIGSLHGGTQACTTPPPTPPVPPVMPPVLPKTGSGTNVFLLGSMAALVGYGVALLRKARA